MLGRFGRPVIALLVGSLWSAVVAAASPADQDSGGPEQVGPGPERGVFVERCRFSHAASDDPIVHPGMPGMSHLHTFFGNVTTFAASTYDSMRAGGTTCRTGQDAAGYWVPALSRDGVTVAPRSATIYYRSGPVGETATIRPFPPGFRAVAGDAGATAPQAPGVTWWGCTATMTRSQTPPACAPGTTLTLHVRFPQCWDGVKLDSADHQGHLAYARRGACPESHPVSVPALTMIVHYPISGSPGEIGLASGGVYSAHADFFNAWEQAFLTARVNDCLNARVDCRPRP